MLSLRVLHLVGSTYNDFYCGLSYRYAEGCLENTVNVSSIKRFQIAYITPDSYWRFVSSLKQEVIDAAKPMCLVDAMQYIKKEGFDLVIPHMYCIPGVTYYRALFDLLRIPYIGNTSDVMALTAHKGRTKAVVAAAGVKVPAGELIRRGDVPTVQPPVVVKPVSADNSLGISLIRNMKDYSVALENAFQHADEVLVEKFIEPGREVRCSIIVKDGQLVALPLEEYLLDINDRPIRDFAVKFPELDDNGKFIGYPEDDVGKHWITNINDPITQGVQEMAKICHRALGCRHYSLFEFRIDPNGEPWFLEAGLFCSFGDGGGLSLMSKAAGISLEDLIQTMIKEAMNTV
ncbi:unnamed protein product [Adineta ricciae]|uniref:ATP-grasp domain-containing protein n=1 Tax=Adineta ricciae TaxID=249248 RepID=A0A815YDM8_ADIRI|nr:unnamed protein product [Adineta ricciae]